MTGTERFGERVAALRRQRGMSQKDLAAAIERSESWVSQVERGVYRVERVGLLQSLADALGVPVQDLHGGAPEPTASSAQDREQPDLNRLRLALSGHAVLDLLIAPATAVQKIHLDDLAGRVESAWQLEHAGRHAALDAILPELVTDLERASRAGDPADRSSVLLLLSRAYQAAAAAFARRDSPDAAWVAADRAIHAAERSDEPLQALAGHFRMAHAFMRLNQLDQAEHVASNAAEALVSRIRQPDASHEELSLFGAMNLVLATISAREGDRAGAKTHLDLAATAATRIGGDRNDFNTEFGPTNVNLHALTIAVDVGDAGEALDIAAAIDSSGLSAERQARFWIDVARAHAQRRHIGDALSALLKAEAIAPERTRGHKATRETIAILVEIAGRRVPKDLTDLAQRAAADVFSPRSELSG